MKTPEHSLKNSGLNLRKRPNARLGLTEILLIGVVVVYAVVLLCGPIGAIAWNALNSGFRTVFVQLTSADARSALQLTLILAGSATVINTVFGIVVALVLERQNFWGRWFLNGLVDLPFAVSPVIAGLMVVLLFGRNGWFTPLLEQLGLRIVFAIPGMVLVTTFVSLPFVVREVMLVLAQVGTSQEQAARTMGASECQIFWRITLPSIRWGLLYGISLTCARAIGEFGAVLVVSGGIIRSTESATLYIFRSMDDRNFQGAYSMSLVLVMISIGILSFMQVLKKRVERRS